MNADNFMPCRGVRREHLRRRTTGGFSKLIAEQRARVMVSHGFNGCVGERPLLDSVIVADFTLCNISKG